MLEACKKSDKILVIIKTDFGKIIGAYAPTTIKEGLYYIKNTEGFTFYFDNDEIKVLTVKEENGYLVRSDRFWFL